MKCHWTSTVAAVIVSAIATTHISAEGHGSAARTSSHAPASKGLQPKSGAAKNTSTRTWSLDRRPTKTALIVGKADLAPPSVVKYNSRLKGLNTRHVSKDYVLKYGSAFRFQAGGITKMAYRYKGRNHHHWSYCCWNSLFRCRLYFDPCTLGFYYWCMDHDCYYPICYRCPCCLPGVGTPSGGAAEPEDLPVGAAASPEEEESPMNGAQEPSSDQKEVNGDDRDSENGDDDGV